MIFGVPTSRCAQSLKYFKTTVLEIWLAQGIHSLFLKKKIIQKNPFFSSFWEKKIYIETIEPAEWKSPNQPKGK